MKIYYPSLQAIHQQTLQLDRVQCIYCKQARQLVSHGFTYKKQSRAAPAAVGKRVRCSNRNSRTGCGRTVQLYLETTIRYMHYTGAVLVAFVMALIQGMSIASSYALATGGATPRNAYRWLHKLITQISVYRSRFHLPLYQHRHDMFDKNPRRSILVSIFFMLIDYIGQPLCARYQAQFQHTFM